MWPPRNLTKSKANNVCIYDLWKAFILEATFSSCCGFKLLKENLGFLLTKPDSVLDSTELHFLIFTKNERRHTQMSLIEVQKFCSEVGNTFIFKDETEFVPLTLIEWMICSKVLQQMQAFRLIDAVNQSVWFAIMCNLPLMWCSHSGTDFKAGVKGPAAKHDSITPDIQCPTMLCSQWIKATFS